MDARGNIFRVVQEAVMTDAQNNSYVPQLAAPTTSGGGPTQSSSSSMQNVVMLSDTGGVASMNPAPLFAPTSANYGNFQVVHLMQSGNASTQQEEWPQSSR